MELPTNIVTFDDLQQYLDASIRLWRDRRDRAITRRNRRMAEVYVDAYQSVRMSVWGEILPLEKEKHDAT